MSIYGKGSNLNSYFKVTFEDILVSSLTDLDGDGLFTGLLTMPAGLQAAAVQATQKLTLTAINGATETSYSSDLQVRGERIAIDWLLRCLTVLSHFTIVNPAHFSNLIQSLLHS